MLTDFVINLIAPVNLRFSSEHPPQLKNVTVNERHKCRFYCNLYFSLQVISDAIALEE